MSTGTAVATTERKSVIRVMANRYGMEADTFENTVRATCMPQGNNVAPMTREEFAAGIMVAENYGLNPILREIYFYPKQGGGIVPVVSIDGWLSLINRRKELDGIEFDELHDDAGKLVSITCRIYRRDRQHPTIVTEHLSECIRDTKPWKMQHRMLRHKALIQCARYAFGFAGIHDEDEAERIVEATATVVSGPTAPVPAAAITPPRPAEPTPPSNANAQEAAQGQPVEEGEIVEEKLPTETRAAAPSPAEGGGDVHPLLQAVEFFDPAAWLDEVRDRFEQAKTEQDVDNVHEVYGDTAEGDLSLTDRQIYQDMHEAAMARTAPKGPEQAEVTGEPGPAPEENEAPVAATSLPVDASEAQDDDDSVDEGFPGDDAIQALQEKPKTAGALYLEKIRGMLADPAIPYREIGKWWNDTKAERAEHMDRGELTKEQRNELLAELGERKKQADATPQPAGAGPSAPPPPAGSGPAAPPAQGESEIDAYDREFRARVEACDDGVKIRALSAETLPQRNRFSGTPQFKAWSDLISAKRKQYPAI